MKGAVLIFLFGLLSGVAHARPMVVVPHARPLTGDCVADAALEHGLPFAALLGILAVEGGKEGEAQGNTNGTWDLGPFQVNTCHLNTLADQGFTPEAVLLDGCVNARAAAWILRREYARTGDLWSAIGAYHSRTPKFHTAYVSRVRKHLARLGKSGLALKAVQP
jgi:hypothetical protein